MITTPETKRKPEESLDEYLLRLGLNKELYNLDKWDDIRDLMNAESTEDFTESKWRKDFHTLKRGYDLAVKNNVSEDEVYRELKDQELQIEKETMRLRDQRREYKNLIRSEARFEGIKLEVNEAVDRLAKLKPLFWSPPLYSTDKSDKEAALILSDWHKGLFARNYWNNFDNEVFYKRVRKLTDRAIIDARRHDIKTLHVFSIGDMVNGLIHITTRINSVEDVITQTKEVSETLAEVLCRLANEFETIRFYQCRGNHDRVSPNKSDELAHESFADIIPWFLKTRLSHVKNIEFVENEYDDEIVVADICGNTVFASHGHRDRVSSVVENLTLMIKKFPDYVLMGHIHHHVEDEVHGVEVIVNSSLSGVDSYAKEIRKTSKPAQKLIIFDREEGRYNTYNIRLDNAK